MAFLHQSYEDFRLDALLKYDLADDDDEKDNIVDSESVNSGIVDEATFDELYTSIPDVIYEVHNAMRDRHDSAAAFIRSPSILNITKRTRNVPSQKIGSRQTQERSKSLGHMHGSLIRTVGTLLRPQRGNSSRIPFTKKEARARRGIERNMSTQTALTLLTLDDVSSGVNDDVSCSLCYIDDINDDDGNDAVDGDDKNKRRNHTTSSSASVSSEVLADEELLDDYETDNLHCTSSLTSSSSVALADECYNVILNNSADTALSIDINAGDDDDISNDDDDDDDDDEYKQFTTNDPLLNRSLSIIESRGLQALFFDDYSDDDDSNNKNLMAAYLHRSMISTSTTTGGGTSPVNSRRPPRPYSLGDF